MTQPWRAWLLTVAIQIAAVGAASAQTVIVTRVAKGSSVEIWLNGAQLGTATADADGIATFNASEARGGKDHIDVHLAAETCDTVFRVQIVEPGVPYGPLRAGCTRTEISGLYLMAGVTTFVVDASVPTTWLRQGKPPKSWLHPEGSTDEKGEVVRPSEPLPNGLIVSGGGGISSFSNALGVACGNADSCTGGSTPGVFMAGLSYWFNEHLAVDVSFIKPLDLKYSGSGNNDQYEFGSTLTTGIGAISGKVGMPLGIARLYGMGGFLYHQAFWTTAETVTGSTTVQNFGLEAPGWGWLAGGGAEFWMSSKFGAYVEGTYIVIRGGDRLGGEGRIDDQIFAFTGGVRFHLGK